MVYSEQIYIKLLNLLIIIINNIAMWRHGVVVITTAQLHSTKPELRLCTGSNPACRVSEIPDSEYI